MQADDSIRGKYERHGFRNYYRDHAGDYANPHEPEIRQALATARERFSPALSRVLDLAAGSGEATLALRELGATHVEAIEPFLFEQYHQRTGQIAERLTFENIGAGAIATRTYTLIVCSFALHLVEASRLPGVCGQLALVSPHLLVLTPHKRPAVRPEWGWTLAGEFVWARVRCRFYASAQARSIA